MIDTPTIALIKKWLSAYDVPYIREATHIIKYHIKRKTTQKKVLVEYELISYVQIRSHGIFRLYLYINVIVSLTLGQDKA